ncbi:MAG: hypothetical protein KKB57_08685, partial [Proteobacteria bacterium]|nr:hypothetical protein [Pseudomonadota bacterium]
AFWINSLYIVFLASLVSRHFQIRMREYLEIKGRMTKKVIDEEIRRTVELIGRFLSPPETPAAGRPHN